MIRIGLYSEDRSLQPILASALGSEFEVLPESDEIGVELQASSGQCDVILLDLHSARGLSRQRVEASRQLVLHHAPSVVLADDGLRATALELVRAGAYGYCRRPPSIRELKLMLSRAHENSVRKQQVERVPERIEEESSCDKMIGSSPQMQQVYQHVASVTNLSASVLIIGESGTGKELIARAIHNLGSRASRPFVAVSCGAIPETLIESELFGHEKGAFTGTAGAREGLFEQAGDGTIFLDEIGELSLYTQVKLLRVLQQREFSRLGSNKLTPSARPAHLRHPPGSRRNGRPGQVPSGSLLPHQCHAH